MNINLGSLFDSNIPLQMQNDTEVQGNCTDVSGSVSDIISGEKIADLSGLKPGDLFEGVIEDIVNKDVKIILSGDSVVNATMNESVSLNIGERVVFQVKDNSDSGTVIKPVHYGIPDDALVNKALAQAGLSGNQKNLAVVRELINQGQPLNKETIMNTLRSVNRFPDADTASIVTLEKHNLPVNEGNINMIDSYRASEGGITDSFEKLQTAVNDLINELDNKINIVQAGINDSMNQGNAFKLQDTVVTEDKSVESIVAENKSPDNTVIESKVLTLESVEESAGKAEVAESVEVPEDKATATVGAEPPTGKAVATENIEAPGKAVATGNEELPESKIVATRNAELHESKAVATGNIELPESKMESSENAELPESKVLTTEDAELAESKIVVSENEELPVGKAVASEGVVTSEGKAAELESVVIPEGKTMVSENTVNTFKSNVTEAGLQESIPKDSHSEIIKGEVTPDIEILNNIKDQLKEVISKKYFPTPEEYAAADNSKKIIDKAYKQIEKQLEKIENIVRHAEEKEIISEKNAQPVMVAAKNVNQNFSFMNDLNSLTSYVQIPVKMNNEETQGELFIYNRNKKKTAEDGINAFLHFDLENLGATDIRIKLKSKSLRLEFSLDDKEAVELVEKHIDELTDSLEEKGYMVNCKVEYETPDEKKNVIDNIFENDNTKISIKRYSFDIRT